MDGDLLDLLQQTNIPSSVVEALQQIGVTTVPRLHDLTRDDIEGIINEGDPAIRPVAARVQAQRPRRQPLHIDPVASQGEAEVALAGASA